MDTQQLRQTMVDIEARHADIMALEKNIRELHELFIDMATLIEQQGDKIDRIENHVANSRSYVEKGREQTTAAVKYQSKARTVSLSFNFLFHFLLLLSAALEIRRNDEGRYLYIFLVLFFCY